MQDSNSWKAFQKDHMRVCVCSGWSASSVQMGRGSMVSLFSCWRAWRVKSCGGSHTRSVTEDSFSRLGLERGPRLRRSHTLNQSATSAGVSGPRHGAESGQPLPCAIVTASIFEL